MQSNPTSLNSRLDCLYYPFSRLLDPATLKYLLLVFDSISFLDEAESTERRQLLKNMQETASFFGRYEELADDYSMLEEEGALHILSPTALTAPDSSAVALSVLADLEDPNILHIASRPERYGLPFRPSYFDHSAQTSRPTWQTFQGKIPRALREDTDFAATPAWAPHLLYRGDAHEAWSLSYEAGSVCAINYHLEAAQELGLTPITTSALHHRIVVRKLKRLAETSPTASQVLDDEILARCRTALSHGEILRLMERMFSANQLRDVTFSEILAFRRETFGQRRAFLQEICETIRILEGDPSNSTYDRQVAVAMADLRKRVLEVQAEISSARDKLLPSMTDTMLYGAAGTGALGTLGTFLGGLSTGGLVAASALTVSGGLASKAAQYWVERRQVIRKQSAAVSYLMAMDRLAK